MAETATTKKISRPMTIPTTSALQGQRGQERLDHNILTWHTNCPRVLQQKSHQIWLNKNDGTNEIETSTNY